MELYGKSICTALVQAQNEFNALIKDSANPFYKSKYADLSACIESVRPALHKAGLAVIQSTTIANDGEMCVDTILIHTSGESLQSRYPVRPAKPNDPQSLGASLTYARRYSLCSLLCIASEDDDGNTASDVHNRTHQQPKPTALAPNTTTNTAKISDAQRKRLFAIGGSVGLPDDEAKKIISRWGFSSSADITRDKYQSVCDDFQRYTDNPLPQMIGTEHDDVPPLTDNDLPF